MNWQPIETAPMDGTAIWLLVEGQPYIGYGERANWLSSEDRWFVKASFRRKASDQRTDEIYGCHGVAVPATQWMPLPEPPAL